MRVYSCEHNWEAMLTCIYVAWASGLGHQNIRLEIEPLGQCELFTEYVHVDSDITKAESVMDSVNRKISPMVYHELAYSAMAYESDVLDNIYRVMILGFAYGPNVLDMVQYKDVMRNREIRTRLGKEACRFKEVVRFHEVSRDMYVAHIEPKSKIVVTLGPAFQDRMPSENWIIIDDIHKEAVIHVKNQPYYLRVLDEEEYLRLLETEKENDEYTDLWKVFFDAIAIKERNNPRCQRNLIPKWTRKHAVEFL